MRSAFHFRLSILLKTISSVVLMCMMTLALKGQNTVLKLARSTEETADIHYAERSYFISASLYERVRDDDDVPSRIHVKLGRCYYHLRKFPEAVLSFETSVNLQVKLNDADRVLFAEALTALGRYDEAAEQYALHNGFAANTLWIRNKVWRLKNVRFLFEDSAQYSVRRLLINSKSNDFAPTRYGNGIVFLSNRRVGQFLKKTDAVSGGGFYKIYHSEPDTTSSVREFAEPELAFKSLQSKYHNGPLCFYSQGRKVAYTVTSASRNSAGERKLEIHFAEKTAKGWVRTGAFPFNGKDFSNSDPFVSEDGKEIYFASDRKGGFGGRDIYRSKLESGKWLPPVNLGEVINTPLDECFPFIENAMLYFASNGQPGLGGLDIFRSEITSQGFGEVQNLGYPANTRADDFGLVLGDGGYQGYFSSSRNGSAGDDVYEIQIDQQSYPLVIEGVLKLKEFSWVANDTLRILPKASIQLIDHTRNVVITEVTTDDAGRFSLPIPYFSFYRIRVEHPDRSEAFVSFEIPRKRKEDYFHEIVVVRDAFKSKEQKDGYD